MRKNVNIPSPKSAQRRSRDAVIRYVVDEWAQASPSDEQINLNQVHVCSIRRESSATNLHVRYGGDTWLLDKPADVRDRRAHQLVAELRRIAGLSVNLVDLPDF